MKSQTSLILNIRDHKKVYESLIHLKKISNSFLDAVIVVQVPTDCHTSIETSRQEIDGLFSILNLSDPNLYVIFKAGGNFPNKSEELKYILSIGLCLKGLYLWVAEPNDISDLTWIDLASSKLRGGKLLLGKLGIMYLCASNYPKVMSIWSHHIVFDNLALPSDETGILVDLVVGSFLIERSCLALLWKDFPSNGNLSGYIHIAFCLQKSSIPVKVIPSVHEPKKLDRGREDEKRLIFNCATADDQEYFYKCRLSGWRLYQEKVEDCEVW
jgi:hypothetical protein